MVFRTLNYDPKQPYYSNDILYWDMNIAKLTTTPGTNHKTNLYIVNPPTAKTLWLECATINPLEFPTMY